MDGTETIRTVFGTRVRALREAKGWELEELAARLGKSKSSMSRIETGKQNLTLKAIATIATALEVSIPLLFGAADAAVPVAVVAGIVSHAETIYAKLGDLSQDAELLRQAVVPLKETLQADALARFHEEHMSYAFHALALV